MPLILASASPRRQELLRNAGIEFVVMPADIPEVPLDSENPSGFAERMAREKANTIWTRVCGSNTHTLPETGPDKNLVLSADTVVAINHEILGKPADAVDAARMLRLLSGHAHLVTTAVCLKGESFEDVRSETTTVHFMQMSDSEIAQYVASGEPMDKAGAYAIQGIASRWITKIEGDYSNVVGLPVDLVRRMLREHGVMG